MKKHTDSLGKEVTEISVICQIITLMNNHGYCVWRHSNTGGFNSLFVQVTIEKLFPAVATGCLTQKQYSESVRTTIKRGWRKTPGQLVGIPDIVGFNLLTGKFVAVELKIGLDTLSQEQRQFNEKAKNAGSETYIVKDFPVFSQYLRKKQSDYANRL